MDQNDCRQTLDELIKTFEEIVEELVQFSFTCPEIKNNELTKKLCSTLEKILAVNQNTHPTLPPAVPPLPPALDGHTAGKLIDTSLFGKWNGKMKNLLSQLDKLNFCLLDNKNEFEDVTESELISQNEFKKHINDSSPEWMPDGGSAVCLRCAAPFTFINRKVLTVIRIGVDGCAFDCVVDQFHHCRYCGKLVCAKCSRGRVRLHGVEKRERVCDKCYNDLMEHNAQIEQGTTEEKDLDLKENIGNNISLVAEKPDIEKAKQNGLSESDYNDMVVIVKEQDSSNDDETGGKTEKNKKGQGKRGKFAVWMPDRAAAACLCCAAPFTTTNRRHHCRFCGKLFCGKCCDNFVYLPFINEKKTQRICDECFEIVMDPEKMEEYT